MEVVRRLLRGRIPSLLSISCSCMLIGVAFILCVQRTAAIQTHVPVSVFNAIPPAISSVVFGHKKKYTSLVTVSDMFRSELGDQATDARAINETISRIANSDLATTKHDYRLMAVVDEKGIVDFVEIAFRLFGLRVESTVYLYFVVLFASCCCFILGFHGSPSCLLLLAGFLVGFYLILPAIAFNPQLASILMLRAIPILAIVACLHCVLYALLMPQGRHHVLLAAIQSAVLILVVHMRITAMWQVFTVAAVSMIACACHSWQQTGHRSSSSLRPRIAFQPLWPLLLLVVAYVGLQGYRAWASSEEYQRGEQTMTRTIWHNVFSGLAFHPTFRERYRLRIDDNSVIQAAGEYLVEKGREREWGRVGTGPPQFSVTHWAAYDKVVAEMLRDRCSSYLSECMSATFYYKPLSLARTLAWLYGVRALPPDLDTFVSRYWGDAVKVQMLELGRELDKQRLRAYMWTPLAVLVLLPFAGLLVGEDRYGRRVALVGIAALSAGSTMPTLVGYPAAFTVADTAIACLMLIYFCFCAAVASLLGWVWRMNVSPTAS